MLTLARHDPLIKCLSTVRLILHQQVDLYCRLSARALAGLVDGDKVSEQAREVHPVFQVSTTDGAGSEALQGHVPALSWEGQHLVGLPHQRVVGRVPVSTMIDKVANNRQVALLRLSGQQEGV